MTNALFRTVALLLAGAYASLASAKVQCPLDEKTIAEIRNAIEWHAFWIEPGIAAEYTAGAKTRAELVVSNEGTVVYLPAPTLECWFSSLMGRMKLVDRYVAKSAQVAAMEYLAILRRTPANRGGCIPIIDPQHKGSAKGGKPSGNVVSAGRLCPPGQASAEGPRHESCEFVLPELRITTYPNAPIDTTALERLLAGVRTQIRQEFIDDSVGVTIPRVDFGDPEVFIFVESKKYRTRGLLPMHPTAGGGWEPDKFIVDVPKNNIGALIEKVKGNQIMHLRMP